VAFATEDPYRFVQFIETMVEIFIYLLLFKVFAVLFFVFTL